MSIDKLDITPILHVTQRSTSGDHGNDAMAERNTIYSTVRLCNDLKIIKGKVGEVWHLLRIVGLVWDM